MMQSHLTFAIGYQHREVKLAEYHEKFEMRMDTWMPMTSGKLKLFQRKQGVRW